jgi:TP901-1 family phage major tail protein
MAATKGRDFLLKISDGISPATFTTIGGLRTTSLTIGNETVDITTKDEAPFRILLGDTGIRTVSISADGVFEDGASAQSLEDEANNGTIQEYQIVDGNGDIYQGTFIATSYEKGGDYNTELTFSVTLESAGIVTLIRA